MKNKGIIIAAPFLGLVAIGSSALIAITTTQKQKQNEPHVTDPGDSVKKHAINTNQYTYTLTLDKEYRDNEVSVNLLFKNNKNDNNITWFKQVSGKSLYVTVKAKEGSYDNDIKYSFDMKISTSSWEQTITDFEFNLPKCNGEVSAITWKQAINDLLKDDESFKVTGHYKEEKITGTETEVEQEYDFTSNYFGNVSSQQITKGDEIINYYFDYYSYLYWLVTKNEDNTWTGKEMTEEKFGSDDFYDVLSLLSTIEDQSTSEMEKKWDDENQCYYYKGSFDSTLLKSTHVNYGFWFDKTYHIAKSEIKTSYINPTSGVKIAKDSTVDYSDYGTTTVELPFESEDVTRNGVFKANFDTADNCFKVTVPDSSMGWSNRYYCITLDLTDTNIPDTFTIKSFRGEYKISEQVTIKKDMDYAYAIVDGEKHEATITDKVATLTNGITINKSQLPNIVNFVFYSDSGNNSPFTFYLEQEK